MRELTWTALPADLAADLQPVPNRQQIGAQRMWDLAYLLALDDRRTAGLLSVTHDGSRASVDPATGRIGWAGTEGPALRDRMLALARQWVTMGRPSAGDFTSRFTPLSHTPPAAPATQRWIIDWIDYQQTVTLNNSR